MSVASSETIPQIRDFDFIHGRWNVAHRRLKIRGGGRDGVADWDVFDAVASCEPRLGGLANIEEMSCPARGWSGMAVRTLDVASGEWSIHWVNSLDGVLQPPVRGRFTADGCTLEGPDTDGDRPIIARYIWSDIRPDSARWSQAFSYDSGATWEVNWIMDFTQA
ncbi:DUF1579 domain-containing protein [Brevundimonas sp.]|uniref:DUF1579 domain-containing protein n=1 Tax=Brevundimonas sp. TaxID=1871086 RepID=UPI003D6C859E